ncbi:MAG: MerR family transcriptional regulator [Candidatus Omnitrophica bacterium]|nr:MerR family transcriptional regulator [Candidatus Omnitrophota bacterium]
MTNNRIDENDMITAKEIMSEFNVSYQIVNHYTNFGLLPVIIKKANIRYYDRSTIKNRLKFRELMQQGYSLSLIRKKLMEEANTENFANSPESIIASDSQTPS